MYEAAKVIELIGRTSGYNDKLYLLKKNEHVDGLKPILKFIYDPYIRTGISTAKLDKALNYTSTDFVDYISAINYFTRHTTGSDMDLIMAARFINCTRNMFPLEPAVEELAKAIVTQKLTIGITAKSLNSVFTNFIPIVGCILGKPYDKVQPQTVKWPCIITEKLDGVRRILIKENGVCRLYSRSGHEDTGLAEILSEAQHLLPDNFVYDGELLAEGTFKDCIAQRQATNSIAATKGDKHGLSFNVFDMIPSDEFRAGKSKNNAMNRKIRLGATLMDESIEYLVDNPWEYIQAFGIHIKLQHIKPVPILGLAQCMADVEPIVAEIFNNGGEGVMLNTTTGLYEIKRSSHLLKIKHTKEYKLTVVNLLEGTGKFEGMLGALVVDYNGTMLGVGSGLTDEQRMHIWDYPEKYIGRKVEIETFGESTNMQGGTSLNCPIFKRFVGVTE